VDELQRRVVGRIRELAKQREIVVTHLPDRAGVTRSHFWQVLNGNASPTLGWITKIAKALGVDPMELLRLDPAKRRRR
jgi:transcriptional regulator with XRE-family HTH domain